MRPSLSDALLVAAALSTAHVVRAQDEEAQRERPRFHVGLAVGQSRVPPDLASAGAPPEILDRFGDTSPSEDPAGWKLVAGFRPTRIVGAEIQYVDFGTAEIDPPSGHGIVRTHISMQSSADAAVLAALLFVPLRSPALDVYGKIGVAQLDESFQATALLVGPPCVPFACSFDGDADQTDSHPYYGVGFRHEIGRATAFRVEYEMIDHDKGDDVTMFSFGIAWER